MIARSSFAWSSCHCARLLHSCAITHGIQLIVSLHHYAIIPIAANEFRIISMWNFIHYISGSEHSEEKTRKCQQQLPFSNGKKIIRQECNGMRFIRWHVYFPFCIPLALWTHQYLFSIFMLAERMDESVCCFYQRTDSGRVKIRTTLKKYPNVRSHFVVVNKTWHISIANRSCTMA